MNHEEIARALASPEEVIIGIIDKQNQAIVALDKLDDLRAADIAELRLEQAELRDELLALSNRIEGVHRAALRALNLTTLGEETA